MHCLRSYYPDSGCVFAIWLLNQVAQQISANKKKRYWPNWVETFQKWKVKDMTVKRWQKRQRHGRKFWLSLTPKILTVSKATSVSFKDAEGGWNSGRKRNTTYIVVKQEKLACIKSGCLARRPLCHRVNLLSCVARRPLFNKVYRECEAWRRLFVTVLNSMIYIIYILLPCFCIIFPRFFWFSTWWSYHKKTDMFKKGLLERSCFGEKSR